MAYLNQLQATNSQKVRYFYMITDLEKALEIVKKEGQFHKEWIMKHCSNRFKNFIHRRGIDKHADQEAVFNLVEDVLTRVIRRHKEENKWIELTTTNKGQPRKKPSYECPKCGCKQSRKTHYCPDCGSRMKTDWPSGRSI